MLEPVVAVEIHGAEDRDREERDVAQADAEQQKYKGAVVALGHQHIGLR
jgi:hypothetical protein